MATTTTTARATNQTEPVSIARIWQWTGISAVVSTILNVILFYIADATGWIPRDFLLQPLNQSLSVIAVILSTIIGVVLAGAVFTGLARFTARPITIFRIVGLVALVLSFASPLSVPNASLAFILTLEVMHVLAAAVVIYTLTTFTRR